MAPRPPAEEPSRDRGGENAEAKCEVRVQDTHTEETASGERGSRGGGPLP